MNRVQGAGSEGEALRAAFRAMIDVLGIPLGAQSTDLAADAAPFIELLIETRAALRKERQFALADQLRDRLRDLGVALEDTPEGTKWRLERGAPASSA